MKPSDTDKGQPLTRASFLNQLLKRGLVLRQSATAEEIADGVRLYELAGAKVKHDGRSLTVSDAYSILLGERLTLERK